jgi:hypothetical protein
MRFFLLNILALIIALSTAVHEEPVLDGAFRNSMSISQHPAWELDDIRVMDSKSSAKHNAIIDSFKPIILIADFNYVIHDHDFYLSIHRLYRVKDYFLLI